MDEEDPPCSSRAPLADDDVTACTTPSAEPMSATAASSRL